MRAYQLKVENSGATADGRLSAAEDSTRFYELTKAVETAGITLDAYGGPDVDKQMLAQAMARYASGGVFGDDSGAANAYVVGAVLTFQAPKAYFLGMTISFYPDNTNTSASTVNAFGLGIKKILSPSGAALTGGELIAGRFTAMAYDPAADGAAGAFKLFPWALPPAKVPAVGINAYNPGSPQSFSNGVYTVISTLTTENTNLDDATFSSGRLTAGARTAGIWSCAASVGTNGVTGNIFVNIRKNGINYAFDAMDGSGISLYASPACDLKLASGDYVEALLFNGTGSSLVPSGYTVSFYRIGNST